MSPDPSFHIHSPISSFVQFRTAPYIKHSVLCIHRDNSSSVFPLPPAFPHTIDYHSAFRYRRVPLSSSSSSSSSSRSALVIVAFRSRHRRVPLSSLSRSALVIVLIAFRPRHRNPRSRLQSPVSSLAPPVSSLAPPVSSLTSPVSALVRVSAFRTHPYSWPLNYLGPVLDTHPSATHRSI